jgi:hypothetical protein
MLTTNLTSLRKFYCYYWKRKMSFSFYVGAVIHHYGNLKWDYKTQGRKKKWQLMDDTRPREVELIQPGPSIRL